jgi:hypothetical protein
LSGWKRNFLTYTSRELLVKTVLSVMPTHLITVFKPPKGTISNIDRYKKKLSVEGERPRSSKRGTLFGQLANLSQTKEIRRI